MEQEVAQTKTQKFEQDCLNLEQQIEENPKITKKREVDDLYLKKKTHKNLIRYLNIIVDLTQTMKTTDMQPSRIGLTIQNLNKFVELYFDKNPLSLLGIGSCANQICEQQIDFASHDSIFKKQLNEHKSKLKEVQEKGHFSLQAVIEQQMRVFQDVPLHAFKEVLIIQSSPSTFDVGDIFEAINRISKCNIKVSIVSLNSKTHIFNKLVQATGGNYKTVMSDSHYWQLLKQFTESDKYAANQLAKELIPVGFPSFVSDQNLRLCSCHQKFQTEFFECPKCFTKNCSIPSNCLGCKINLISPIHLARTMKHYSNLQQFTQVQMEQENLECTGCNNQLNSEEKTQCKDCKNYFCLDCDIFIHEKLMNCPGCI